MDPSSCSTVLLSSSPMHIKFFFYISLQPSPETTDAWSKYWVNDFVIKTFCANSFSFSICYMTSETNMYCASTTTVQRPIQIRWIRECLKDFVHVLSGTGNSCCMHLKDLSPVWVCRWTFRAHNSLKDFEHA